MADLNLACNELIDFFVKGTNSNYTNMINWGLTSELIAYIVPGTNLIFLAGIGKKKYLVEVLKLIGDHTYQEFNIHENKFQIKISGNDDLGVKVLIKSPELPADIWYELKNYYIQDLWKIITTHKMNIGGEFDPDVFFEVGFTEDNPYVILVEPGMKEFKIYFEEMRRKLYLEICKKTSKWIPGHRYELPNKSIFYLASTKSRRENEGNSDFITDPNSLVNVYIYTEVLEDTDTDIDTVLRKRAFGNNPEDLKILYKPITTYDAGEVLKDNFSGDIQDYWADIFQNSIRNRKTIKDALDVFSLISNTPYDKTKFPYQQFVDYTKETLFNIIIDNWDLTTGRADTKIGPSLEENKNAENIKKILLSYGIKDVNFLKSIYYTKLYEYLGVDLIELSKDCLNKWSVLEIDKEFDLYLKYIRYYEKRLDGKKSISSQRVKSTKYKLNVVTIKDLFGESELRDTIIDTINSVRNDFGYGASQYSIVNVGTKKNPMEYVICTLTLDNIIKYKKGINMLSETLKKEIMSCHFVQIQVVFDIDCVLE